MPQPQPARRFLYTIPTNYGTLKVPLDRAGLSPDEVLAIPEVAAHLETLVPREDRSTTTTPTTTEGVPGRGLQIPRAVDPYAKTAGAIAGSAAGTEAGPAGMVAGAGLGSGIVGQLLELLRGSPGAAAAASREALGRARGQHPALEAGQRALEDVETGAVGEMGGQVLGKVATPIVGAIAKKGARLVGHPAGLTEGERVVFDEARRRGIELSPGDITGSRTAKFVESLPSYFTLGGGFLRRLRGRQFTQAGRATGEMVDELAQSQADEITAGRLAQGGMQGAAREFRRDSDRLFREFDARIGDDPIDVPRTMEAAQNAVERARATPYGPTAGAAKARGAAQASDVYEPTGEVSAARETRPAPSPPASGAAAIEGPAATTAVGARGANVGPAGGAYESEYVGDTLETLIHEAAQGRQLSWRQLRDMEAQLGEIAFRGGKPIAGIRQGQAAALYRAVRDDIDTFMREERPGMAPELAELKQRYQTGKALWNESVAKRMAGGAQGRGAVAPEKIVSMAFRPGQVSDTLAFKLAVDDATYEQATSAWLRRLYDEASPGGAFSPQRFVKAVDKYARNEHLDVILPPADATALRGFADVLRKLGPAERQAGLEAVGQTARLPGQRLSHAAQLAMLGLPMGLDILGARGGGDSDRSTSMLTALSAAGLVAGPALGFLTTNPRMLGMRAPGPGVTPTMRFLSQLAAQTGLLPPGQ